MPEAPGPLGAYGPGGAIRFEIPVAFYALNTMRNMGFAEYPAYRRRLAAMIAEAAGSQVPAEPFECARVTIVRHARTLPDVDNLYGGAKPVIDCLVRMRPASHPSGLGFVEDDNPLAMEIVVEPCLLEKGGKPRTCIAIEPLDLDGEGVGARLSRMGATPETVRRMRERKAAREAKPAKRPPKAKPASRIAAAAAPPSRMTAEQYRNYRALEASKAAARASNTRARARRAT